MREIKFRAWDGHSMRTDFTMHSDGQMIISSSVYAIGFEPVLMQYTGLKDADGVEIYEGDVIEAFKNKNGALLVEFVNDYVGGWVLTHPSSRGHISLGARRSSELRVIGNIHQNPELLSNKQEA